MHMYGASRAVCMRWWTAIDVSRHEVTSLSDFNAVLSFEFRESFRHNGRQSRHMRVANLPLTAGSISPRFKLVTSQFTQDQTRHADRRTSEAQRTVGHVARCEQEL